MNPVDLVLGSVQIIGAIMLIYNLCWLPKFIIWPIAILLIISGLLEYIGA
ncbi:MAG: hypothetical protein J7K22_01010 [Nanoarchaeota archaeon]|nr:hypothetical protein [Nanoarchaeota archaeon]